MALQETYTQFQAAGYPGMHANMEEWNGQTKTATSAIAFGAPVQRDGAKGCETFASGGEFLGLAKAMHVATGGDGDSYAAGDNVPVVDEGVWFVLAEGLTAGTDEGTAVNFNTATGAFTVAAVVGGIIAVPNAEIDEVHSATLATIRLRRVPA